MNLNDQTTVLAWNQAKNFARTWEAKSESDSLGMGVKGACIIAAAYILNNYTM